MQPGPVLAVTFSVDGRTLLTVADDGVPRTWPVPGPLAEVDLNRLRLRLEAGTGLGLREGGTVEDLTSGQWQDHRRQLEKWDGSGRGATPVPDDCAWHDARARDAEANRDAFAALWHLDRTSVKDWLLYARQAVAHAVRGRTDLANADHARATALAPKNATAQLVQARRRRLPVPRSASGRLVVPGPRYRARPGRRAVVRGAGRPAP